MGTIRKRSRRSWEVRYDLGVDPQTGKRRFRYQTVRGTKAEARRALREAEHRRDHGMDVPATRLRLSAYLDDWLEEYAANNVADSTLRRYQEFARRWGRLIGGVRLQDLQPAAIQACFRTMQDDGLAARTVLHHHRMLRQALHHAVRWQLLARNPADAVMPPRAVQTEMRALQPEEFLHLLEECPDPQLGTIIHTAGTTGLRRGELLGLRWEDIALDAATLTVRRAAQYLSGEGTKTRSPKTARGRRTLALSAETVRALREHRARQLAHRLELGGAYADEDWVFPDQWGKLQPPYRVSEAFRRVVQRAGLAPLRFHGTYVTLLPP